MVVCECPNEPDVVDAVTTGRWPSRCGEELTAHVPTCGVCSDVVATLGPILEDAAQARAGAPIPPSAVVWWRARLRARDEAIRDAVRPIAVAQVVGLLFLGALIGASVVVAAPWLAGAAASGRQLMTDAAGVVTASAQLGSGWLALAATVGVSLVIAPLALYLALARD